MYSKSSDVILWRATYLFYQYDYSQSLSLLESYAVCSSSNPSCSMNPLVSSEHYVYLCSIYLLMEKRVELYELSCHLSEQYSPLSLFTSSAPSSQCSLYALSCYYTLIQDYVKARMYVRKCILKDYSFPFAWLLLARICHLQVLSLLSLHS